MVGAMSTGSARFWLPRELLRALLATVALVSQLTLGSLVLPDAASARAAASLDAMTILCTSAPAGTTAPVHHHPRPVDQPLGELAAALTLPALLLAPVFRPFPSPATTRLFCAALPPARGPPQRLAWALHVRGPPILA